MARRNIIVGLDVGTTKTAVVLGELYRESQVHILGIGTAPSRGLRGGQVVDIALASQAIYEAADRAERAAGLLVENVCVGIAGSHLRSHSEHAEVSLRPAERRVDALHVNAAVRNAASIALPENREIVAVFPKVFTVDSLGGISDPRGLVGRRLEVDAHVVTCDSNSMRNLEHCMTLAKVGMESRVLQPLASAEACLTPEQRRDGVALVDIGGGTSDVAIFMDDACWHISVLPVGGALVTKDISRGLSLPYSVAEELKIRYARVDPVSSEDASIIEVPGFDRGAPIAVRRRALAEVVDARMEEILLKVGHAIERSGFRDLLAAGVVLTGGASQLQGLTHYAGAILDLPVALGRPAALWGLDDEVRQPEFCTGIGLVLAGLKVRAGQGWLQPAPSGLNALVEGVQDWFRRLLAPGPGWETER